MSWIPSGAFLMGSEDFYPEERPLHRVTVDGFWIDERPVTGGEFRRFVRDTGYVSFCERPIDPTDYPGADPDVLVPAPSYFARPQARSTCATSATGGSACRVPTGSAPRGRTRRSTGATVIRSCTSLTRTPRPTHPGLARNCQPKPNGCTPGQDSVVEPRVEYFLASRLGLILDMRRQVSKQKTPLLRGFLRADDGTRTHDLLHGNAIRNVTACRLVPPRAGLKPHCGGFGLQEAARKGTVRKESACKPLAGAPDWVSDV
jgi:hypothetical protein